MLPRCSLIAICLTLLGSSALRAQVTNELEQLFENSIRPVLTERCFGCHGDPQAKLSGGLHVDSRAGLIGGGDSGAAIDTDTPDSSLLLKAISRVEGVSPMPPNSDLALRSDQIAAFKKWIAGGAPWPEKTAKFESPQHWAFKPLATHDQSLDIDDWIRRKQAAAGVTLAPRADKRTLLRRATFDLTGLPPTYQQVVDFTRDESPQAYARLIDRLLDSPAYGERWGRHWLDIVRYADTAGETADYPVPNAWRYRNYVIEAFQSDKPYNQFLREQIAGDILAEDDSSPAGYAAKVTATGYLAISRRFGFDSENYHHLTIQDTIDTLGQSAMGLSLGCARCHDHKFDPISMQDYYALYGIFDSSRYAFPGSEQKQKVRSMMPLVPARDALVAWRKFDERISALRQSLERNGQPAMPAVLRMLNDMDGDFELQAPAAGGSNGVLVPPWLAEGPVTVSSAAQSPFRNVYGPGKTGIRIEAADSTVSYQVSQAIYPRRTASRDPRILINADFRISNSPESTTGTHQLWLGGYPNSPAIALDIGRNQLRWSPSKNNSTQTRSLEFEPGKWINLRVAIDLASRHATLEIGEPGVPRRTQSSALMTDWNGTIDLLVLRSNHDSSSGPRPAIEFDNLAIIEATAAVNADSELRESKSQSTHGDAAVIGKQLAELVGTDSDFELQTVDAPPSAPWNAGPNSVVKIMDRSQSPGCNLFAAGSLGVHMPNRSQYDGFGCGLPAVWKANSQETLQASFDFRCADASAGGNGSWRFYIGHGPGNSAAVELFFNEHQLFARGGDDRPAVGQLKVGQWYQVELELNLKSRTYTGRAHALDGEPNSFEWQSDFAAGWDGTIDHTFIDSYGHISGIRPALDADNYVVGPDVGLPRRGQPIEASMPAPPPYTNKRDQVTKLRHQLSNLKESLQSEADALQRELNSGPFEMAYAVAEGTPHNVAIQLRGEPSQPGDVVPRGFIKVLGGKPLPAELPGSGRLQLAQWLTRDVSHLTARVMVNRLWQYHFGRGLVPTPNDFGVRGVPPTHPELLDQLASDFIRSGWSMKAMHRRIMLSQTYQQASMWPGEHASRQLSLDYYVGFTRRRLSAEEIRDSILSVSGLLDSTPGAAHPFAAPTSWGYTQHAPFNAVYDSDQRSVYLMTQRLKRHPFLALFDGPDPNASTAVRLGTTVPTQALYFMNDPFVHRASAAWANRLLTADAETVRLRQSFEMAFQREPQAHELEDAIQFTSAYRAAMDEAKISDNTAGVQPLAAWLRTLIGSNEFLHVD